MSRGSVNIYNVWLLSAVRAPCYQEVLPLDNNLFLFFFLPFFFSIRPPSGSLFRYICMQMALSYDIISSGLLNISGDSERTFCLRNIIQVTRRHVPDDCNLHGHRNEIVSFTCPLQTCLALHSPVVTICTTSLTFSNSTFCPLNVFICFAWIWEQTAIISLYSINWLGFIREI